jgi:uncharacterized protein (DUF488 family)
MGNIYTIGYGNIPFEALVNLLKKYEIAILADIRSRPYSKHRPEYRKKILEGLIAKAGMEYLYLGDKLGGMPGNRKILDIHGNVNYELRAQDPDYLEGINQIIELSRKLDICLICAEADPQRCHRSLLVSETLWKYETESLHILHNGKILKHGDLCMRFEQDQGDLFDGTG